MPESAANRWVLLIHQIPPKPDYFRVKVWRRLQRLGAVARPMDGGMAIPSAVTVSARGTPTWYTLPFTLPR